jgi:hypothetical protein
VAEKGRGVAFLLDEVQFVGAEEFGPFVVGLHRLNQKALPVTCVAAGLPSLPALVGEAKSYAERLFEYPRIDRLSRPDAISALRDPARTRDVVFEEGALQHIFACTEGYPYFLQQYGKYAWDVASPGRITIEDAQLGGRQAQERLDEGFFQVRYERASSAERGFLGAMARCEGPPYLIADVTRALGKTDQRSISVQRDASAQLRARPVLELAGGIVPSGVSLPSLSWKWTVACPPLGLESGSPGRYSG